MGRRRTFGKKKFYGNQHISKNKYTNDLLSEENNADSTCSVSQKKIRLDVEYSEVSNRNILVDVDILSNLICGFVDCFHCKNSNCIILKVDDKGRKGLASSISLQCSMCLQSTRSYSSNVSNGMYDINIRTAYAFRCIGKGVKAAKTFCAVMNLPPPPAKFAAYYKVLADSLDSVSKKSMIEAVEESVTIGGDRDISAAFDGTWQKRGHSSLNGVVTATSLETGKVIDIECLTKYCSGCIKNKNQEHVCTQNYSGSSGGMECKGVMSIFERSEDTRNIRYINYLGDGDCRAFDDVKSKQVYGEDIEIAKLECVGHVQKRMGTRLRKLKTDFKNKKLSDGKSLSGRGRLTDNEILLLQRYYGLAIRRNANKTVKDMSKAIWAIYFHKLSTDDSPQHGLCLTGSDTWCGYNRAKLEAKTYDHKHSLPEPVMLVIKPIFRALSKSDLLAKCLHGRTQNPNESFNHCIWERLPKTSFVGIAAMKVGAMDALICFNDGSSSRIKIFEHLEIKPGIYMVNGLRNIDRERIADSDREMKKGQNKLKTPKKLQK